MAVNPKQAAKRAFVTILLALATTYGLLLQITRDSDDAAVLKAFRQVARRAHRDADPHHACPATRRCANVST